MLGSSFGSTNAGSINPQTDGPQHGFNATCDER
jgi:hypothetical protein